MNGAPLLLCFGWLRKGGNVFSGCLCGWIYLGSLEMDGCVNASADVGQPETLIRASYGLLASRALARMIGWLDVWIDWAMG